MGRQSKIGDAALSGRICYNAGAMPLHEALIAVLGEAFLLILLSRLMFEGIIAAFANPQGKGILLGLWRLPGNLVHELSHCLGFLICGYKIKKICLCIWDPRGRGFCMPGDPWAPVAFPQLAMTLAALMPLFVGGALLMILCHQLHISLPHEAMPLPGQGFLAAVWHQSLRFLQKLDFHRWQTYLFLYLTLSIAAELVPSNSDLRYALPSLIMLTASTWLLLFALQHAENLQSLYQEIVSWLSGSLQSLGSFLGVLIILSGAACLCGIVPGLMIHALRSD